MAAARHGRIRVAEFLIQEGAVNHVAENGDTRLIPANGESFSKVCKSLILAGVDPNVEGLQRSRESVDRVIATLTVIRILYQAEERSVNQLLLGICGSHLCTGSFLSPSNTRNMACKF